MGTEPAVVVVVEDHPLNGSVRHRSVRSHRLARAGAAYSTAPSRTPSRRYFQRVFTTAVWERGVVRCYSMELLGQGFVVGTVLHAAFALSDAAFMRAVCAATSWVRAWTRFSAAAIAMVLRRFTASAFVAFATASTAFEAPSRPVSNVAVYVAFAHSFETSGLAASAAVGTKRVDEVTMTARRSFLIAATVRGEARYPTVGSKDCLRLERGA